MTGSPSAPATMTPTTATGSGTATGTATATGSATNNGGSSGAPVNPVSDGGNGGDGGVNAGGGDGGGGGVNASGGDGGISASGGDGGGNAGGGFDTGGAGGMPGASGAGGDGGPEPTQSAGCGAGDWPENGRHTVQSSGMAREYVLDIPNGYDSSNQYPLYFTWHWRGGNANSVVNGDGSASRGPYYGLKERSNGGAIFVSPEGLVDSGVTGWANPNGRDIQFLRDMLDQINADLCIDQQRIFSTGFSYGGMMSHAVGCAMGDVFRAIAPMAGAQFSGCDDGDAPVAFWGSHAPGDGVVGIDLGRQGKDEFVQRNGCSTTTTPVQPSGCVSYEGCQDGYPVVWCEFSGDHYTPDFAPDETWEFFSQF